MSRKKVILLTAGGTGGHFFPAVALAEELQARSDLEIHLSTDNRCRKYLTDDINIPSHIIDLYISRTGFKNRIKLPLMILISLLKSFRLLARLKPSLIIGFGGYPAFPLMLASQLLFIPTVIYEQNSFLGKSNRIFARRAKIIALAYNETKNLPEKYLGKSLVVGDLVRANIKNLKQKSDFNAKTFNLLIIGGSQGASFFSALVPEAIKILIQRHSEIDINIIQQAPRSDQEAVKKIYSTLKVKNTVADFFYDIHKHYESCQLVIARSGATTIAELTQIGQPAIFIPLPSAADDHQYYNAKALQDSNSSWLYRQGDITPAILADKLHTLISAPSVIKDFSLNLLKRKTDGTGHLANTVLKIIS